MGLRDGVLQLELRSPEGKPQLHPLEVGGMFAWAAEGSQSCIGARPPGATSLIPCPNHVVGISGSQCPDCAEAAVMVPCLLCKGERCANPLRRPDCVQPENHGVYLASFGPGLLKVGVARWERRRERLIEQGARAAIVVARDDGQQVRRVEAQIERAGIRDRLPETEKLRGLTQVASNEVLVRELEEALVHLRLRVIGQWLKEPEVIELPELPLLPSVPALVKPREQFRLRGTIAAVCGQTLLINSDSGEQLAVIASALAGYPLREMEADETGAGQMSLSM